MALRSAATGAPLPLYTLDSNRHALSLRRATTAAGWNVRPRITARRVAMLFWASDGRFWNSPNKSPSITSLSSSTAQPPGFAFDTPNQIWRVLVEFGIIPPPFTFDLSSFSSFTV